MHAERKACDHRDGSEAISLDDSYGGDGTRDSLSVHDAHRAARGGHSGYSVHGQGLRLSPLSHEGELAVSYRRMASSSVAMTNSRLSRAFKSLLLGAMLVPITILVHQQAASAQTRGLPNPWRTVYKCSINGKVVYTDDPCLGAQKVDVEPTRGLNKSTGRELSGADVSRERRRETFAEGVKPITGMTAS